MLNVTPSSVTATTNESWIGVQRAFASAKFDLDVVWTTANEVKDIGTRWADLAVGGTNDIYEGVYGRGASGYGSFDRPDFSEMLLSVNQFLTANFSEMLLSVNQFLTAVDELSADWAMEVRSLDSLTYDARPIARELGPTPAARVSAEARLYLAEHPDLQSPLEVLWQAAVGEFGANAELSVELFADPEESDEYLTLYVRQHEYADDLLDQIEAFDDGQGSLFDGCSASILVNTDFQPPQA